MSPRAPSPAEAAAIAAAAAAAMVAKSALGGEKEKPYQSASEPQDTK